MEPNSSNRNIGGNERTIKNFNGAEALDNPNGWSMRKLTQEVLKGSQDSCHEI